MAYPYADDKLNQDNKTDPAGRSNYYGNFTSTPVVFFDGEHQPNAYSQWPATLTTLANQITPLSISLSIIETGAVYTAKASVIELASVGINPLKIHFVLAENVYYAGRNGITHHDYVVRKMLTGPSGIDFVPGGGTTITGQSFALQSGWITDSLSLCVFVQDAVSKKILQSESMKLSSLLTAIRHTNENMDLHFALEQNYPNPFNPSTTITFSVPTNAYTTLKVYSTTGEVIKTVAEGFIEQGTHSFSISLAGMPSGLYLYRLVSN
ncbi:MAG: T9SS type A sorting domain-containing protein [Ignavibacteriales bacterium]|nr:T9SS type A sorting domain-containing protein [Ignavibacteriales bacterium]